MYPLTPPAAAAVMVIADAPLRRARGRYTVDDVIVTRTVRDENGSFSVLPVTPGVPVLSVTIALAVLFQMPHDTVSVTLVDIETDAVTSHDPAVRVIDAAS